MLHTSGQQTMAYGPNLATASFLKVYWHTGTTIHICIVYGHFHRTITLLSSCKRGRPQSLSYLPCDLLYKNLLTLVLERSSINSIHEEPLVMTGRLCPEQKLLGLGRRLHIAKVSE